ncbi:MAG: DUF559 domain-containing protein [Actinobacteria bacterium]|nr:DUF559 domain-containing protein [Actinomycetota bacterium]
MPRRVATDPIAVAILGLAARQHGVIARRQLRDAGLSDEQLLGRAAAGWLTRLHRGVYAVGGHDLSWRGRWMAAVLACGEGALLSHGAAAALWRLSAPSGGDIDVTVPDHGGRARRGGIRLHRSTTLSGTDIGLHDAIPVTSPRRTIVDLAASGTRGRPLERMLDEAERLRLLGPAAFDEGAPPGARRLPAPLRALLREHEAGSTLTRSELEERFLGICRDLELPPPLVNAPLLGLTVDFLWPAAGLVVEVDGRGSHDTRRGFQQDRDRDGILTVSGFRVLRFTWRDVTRRPAVVAERVAALLAS